jgi:AsmA protein
MFKFIFRLLLLLVILVIAALVAIPIFFDPNDYKDTIVAEVKEATGRDLVIDGKLDLSLFPWLGLKTGPLTLANAEGFGPEPFAQVANAEVSVKVLSLLKGRVETQTITLQGLRLNLARDAKGRGNWEDLAPAGDAGDAGDAEKGAGKAQQQGPIESGDEVGEGQALTVTIGGVVVEDAALHWQDATTGQDLSVDAIDLKTGSLVVGQPVDLHLALGVSNRAPEINGKVTLDTRLHADPETGTLRMEGLHLVVKLLGQGVPRGKLDVDLKANGRLDSAGEVLVLEDIDLTLEGSRADGRLQVTGFEQPAIDFKLAVDQLDLNAYVSSGAGGAAAGSEAPAAAAPVTAHAGGAGRTGGAGASEAPAADAGIPLETLRSLKLNGALSVGRLKVSGLQVSDLAVKLVADQGVLTIDPVKLNLYGGSFVGKLRLDAREAQLRTQVEWLLNGAQLGPLLADLSGKESLSGTARVEANLSMVGNAGKAMTRTLSGHSSLALTDGAYTGIDLLYELRLARALFKGKSIPAPGRAKTDFAELSGSFKLKNGIAVNRDLSVKSPILRVKGGGQINLPAETIDYGLSVKITGTLEGQTGKELKQLKGYEIPVTLTGPLSSPKVGVDVEKLLKSELGRQLRKKLDKKLGGKFGGALDGILGTDQGGGSGGGHSGDKSGGGLQDAIPGALKGFFN